MKLLNVFISFLPKFYCFLIKNSAQIHKLHFGFLSFSSGEAFFDVFSALGASLHGGLHGFSFVSFLETSLTQSS